MISAKDRLTTAQWIFERQLSWISAAEVKVGVIVTINVAMLGGLAAAYSSVATRTSWQVLLSLLATALCSVAVYCSALAIVPRLSGPVNSLLFFGRIAAEAEADYCHRLLHATDEDLLADWATQIHRNAQIARDKHGWVRRGMYWSLCGAPAWVAAIVMLVKV